MMMPVKSKEDLEIVPISNDPMMLIVHPDHPLATKELVDMHDLRHEPFVLYKKDFALHDHIIKREYSQCLNRNYVRQHGSLPRVSAT